MLGPKAMPSMTKGGFKTGPPAARDRAPEPQVCGSNGPLVRYCHYKNLFGNPVLDKIRQKVGPRQDHRRYTFTARPPSLLESGMLLLFSPPFFFRI